MSERKRKEVKPRSGGAGVKKPVTKTEKKSEDSGGKDK